MRIKDVEEILGITRKNIRFYEKERLLSPERDCENGYREYTEDDIRKLKAVKLFRKLGISIEDIRLLQSGDAVLEDILEKQIHSLRKEIDNLNEAMNFCNKIQGERQSFKELDMDMLLNKMKDMEKKGVSFMNIKNDEIIRFLPDKFKMQYYESIIKNGQIDNSLLEQIIAYFEEIYKKNVDTEEMLMDVLKRISPDEKSELLLLIKENNRELYDKISGNIFDFEDIITIDSLRVKGTLEQFGRKAIVKASMGSSPRVNEYLKSLFPDIDFVKERQAIGSIPINEISNIHDEIIEAINK